MTINDTSALTPVDAADPRYISNIIVEDRRDGTESVKRITRFYCRALDLENLERARKHVFGTNELLENILSFLPAKNIFRIRKVSKYWDNVVEGSFNLRRKMFLHDNNKPREEVWTLDAQHKVGANDFKIPCTRLNNTQLKFRRVDVLQDGGKIAITPVVLNPMLARHCTRTPNVTKMHDEWRKDGESVNFTVWVDPFRQDCSSLWKRYLCDRPCHRVALVSLTLCFGKATPLGDRTEQIRWKPAKGPMQARDLSPSKQSHGYSYSKFYGRPDCSI